MSKRLKVAMTPSTYAPGVKPAAALALALKGREQPPAPEPAPAANVDRRPAPTLSRRLVAG